MKQTINIYCDESCHLENDRKPIMILDAIWCPQEHTNKLSQQIRDIKSKCNLTLNLSNPFK